jgi:hypothetical protein
VEEPQLPVAVLWGLPVPRAARVTARAKAWGEQLPQVLRAWFRELGGDGNGVAFPGARGRALQSSSSASTRGRSREVCTIRTIRGGSVASV